MRQPARMVRMVETTEYRDAAEGALEAPGDASLVLRARPRSIVMACPDGCGETLVINLDSRADKAWRHDMRGGGLTLFPSVWRDGGCKSHFIVWRGHILWCDRFEEGNREPPYDATMETAVLGALNTHQPRSAVEIADAIDELVWDANRVANRLAQRGLVRSWKSDGGWVFVRTG